TGAASATAGGGQIRRNQPKIANNNGDVRTQSQKLAPHGQDPRGAYRDERGGRDGRDPRGGKRDRRSNDQHSQYDPNYRGPRGGMAPPFDGQSYRGDRRNERGGMGGSELNRGRSNSYRSMNSTTT